MQPPEKRANQRFAVAFTLLVIGLLFIAACAPEDADFTPTPDAQQAQEQLLPTPVPEGADVEVDPKVALLDILRNVLPNPLSANGVTWAIDETQGQSGYAVPPNIGDGAGVRVFYGATSANGAFELTFVAYDTPEQARNQYDFMIEEVRAQQLNNGRPLDRLPEPNITGGGADRGSVALTIVEDTVFLDVLIENFDSTLGDPRNAVAVIAVEAIQEAVARYNTPDTKPEKLTALESVIPEEITLNDATWTRFGTVRPIRDLPFGDGRQVLYRSPDRDETFINFAVFDLPGDATDYYNAQRIAGESLSLSLDFNQGRTDEAIEQTHRIASGTVSGATSVVDLGEGYYVEVDIRLTSATNADELIVDATQAGIGIMQEAINAYGGEAPAEDNTGSEGDSAAAETDAG